MLLAFVFASCHQDVSVDPFPFEGRLVVESYAVRGGDYIMVRVDKTRDPIYKYSPDRPVIPDASVRIIANGTTYLLRKVPYSYHFGSQYYLYTRGMALDSLRLSVDCQSAHAESECSVPPDLTIRRVGLSGNVNSAGLYTSFTLSVDADFPAGDSYYLAFIMKVPVPTPAYPYPLSPVRVATGYFRQTSGALTANFEFEGIQGKFASCRAYATKSGIYQIVFSRIEKKYYDFAIAMMVQYGELDSIIPTETTDIPTDMRGAYGIFTGISSDTLRVTLP